MCVKIDDIKIFEELQSEIASMGQSWRENAEKAEKRQTFAGIQSAMQVRRFFIQNERQELNNKIKSLSKTWSAEVIAKHKTALNEEFNQLEKIIRDCMRNDIKTLVSAKKEAIADMLATPPTTDQLCLMQALEMRKGNVDSLEFTSILPSLFGNYQAMKMLQNIAEQSGNRVTLPVQLDCKIMFDNLNSVEDYLMRACDYLTVDKKELPIDYHAFYFVNPAEKETHSDPVFNGYTELLDSVPQLNTVKVDKVGLSESESAIVKHLFKAVEKFDPADSSEDIKILKHTQKVMREHPETIEMLKLSEYGKYVTEVEEANNSDSE